MLEIAIVSAPHCGVLGRQVSAPSKIGAVSLFIRESTGNLSVLGRYCGFRALICAAQARRITGVLGPSHSQFPYATKQGIYSLLQGCICLQAANDVVTAYHYNQRFQPSASRWALQPIGMVTDLSASSVSVGGWRPARISAWRSGASKARRRICRS